MTIGNRLFYEGSKLEEGPFFPGVDAVVAEGEEITMVFAVLDLKWVYSLSLLQVEMGQVAF